MSKSHFKARVLAAARTKPAFVAVVYNVPKHPAYPEHFARELLGGVVLGVHGTREAAFAAVEAVATAPASSSWDLDAANGAVGTYHLKASGTFYGSVQETRYIA